MDKQKKSLLCMYVSDFCGIKKESFNFCMERRYMIKEGKISRISRKTDDEIKDLPKDFWGKNISAVTLLIGENGAGKTTLMRLLIKWLCQLSVGHIPQEKGALIISVDDEDKLIAFDHGEPWAMVADKNEKVVRIESIDKIKKLLSDIRLAYYTDTMTDLELDDILTPEELDFLQDDSLLTRLSNSEKDGYTVESIKDCIKREEFRRQMGLFLYRKKNPDNMPEFPIRYMKLTAIKAGDEKAFERISDGNGHLIREAIDFWNKVFAYDDNHSLLAIIRALLWGLFSGTVISLLQWERTLPNLEKSIITEQVRLSLRAYIRINDYDWNAVFRRFFKNLFSDCERGFCDIHREKEFRVVWDRSVENKINEFLDMLKEIEDGEFLKKWMPSENAQNVWEFKLAYFNEKDKNGDSILMKGWRCLWENYLTVAYLMPECRFDWLYPSSGETNKANLYYIMRADDTGKRNNMWFLLDEPDNTFHPDWKRKTIQELLDTCSYNINFQLLISTHSPIMLSDVPKQAAILLKIVEKKENNSKIEKKQQKYLKSSPFGQQIYTLFNDAFFMEQGIIGAFADRKIGEVYKKLYEIEKQISKRKYTMEENKGNGRESDLNKYRCIIKLIEEPLLQGCLSQSYKLCSRGINELR